MCHAYSMNKTQNPYRLQMIQQGRDPVDAPVREVPARFRDRFATYEEYQEAIAEMLNGMWQSTRCHTTACDPLESVQIYHHEQNTNDQHSPGTSGFHVRYYVPGRDVRWLVLRPFQR